MVVKDCPKCNKPITTLRWYGEATGEFLPSQEFGGRVEELEALDGGIDEFECPRCRQVLFESWSQAVQFFKE